MAKIYDNILSTYVLTYVYIEDLCILHMLYKFNFQNISNPSYIYHMSGYVDC